MSTPSESVRLGLAAAHRCRRRVHLDHDPDADRSRQRPIDDGVQLRLDVLAAHRRALRDRLFMTLPRGFAYPWTVQSPWVGAERPPLIWQARLSTEHRIATADLLMLMPDGGYLPIIIRGHRTTDPGRGAELTDLADLAAWGSSYLAGGAGRQPTPSRSATKKLRAHSADISALAHLYRMLQELGVASTEARGGVIGIGGPTEGSDDGGVVAWHRLDVGERTALEIYDEAFADRLAVATAAARRQPALAQPSRIGECRRCPWWTVCGPQLAAARDVSLLASGDDLAVLRGAGAVTYDDVAAMGREQLAALPLSGNGELRVRARAMARDLPLVWRDRSAQVTRADVEFDIDMESYGDDGAYLWGTYLTGVPVDGFAPGYRGFATWQPLESTGTAANFVQFWQYLSALRAACARTGLTFAAYCYSHRAEERWLYGTPERHPDEPGMPSLAEVREFCESAQWVDLYVELKRLFVIPGSMRLKVLAPLTGFSWRDPDPGGANSMAWYRIALGENGAVASGLATEAQIAENRARILRYNEDDVLATLRLREWISLGAGDAPTVAELDAHWA